MSWIKTIAYHDATGTLKKLYDRIKGPDDNIDNLMLAHSLRAHSMQGHMALYKSVLHHSRNQLPKSFLETLGVYVSSLNQCDYCVDHHFAGLSRLLKDDKRSAEIHKALTNDDPAGAFEGRELAALDYAKKLTLDAASMADDDIAKLREAGFDDGEVLEINQVVAYFAYANRTVLGLGVRTAGDVIGLSPNNSDDPDNWQHS